MDGENIENRWNSSTLFIISMVGAIIGLNGIWRFSYLVYENGGGTFLIPYIIAIVVMAVPFLTLEFGLGYRFQSSLPRIFYNIKEEFEIIGWFVVFLIFMVLVYFACVIAWDLVYAVLSLFKMWGSNPSVFFTSTLLHSTPSPYGLTYLVVPVGIALLFIWGLIYFISKRDINSGIAVATKISMVIVLIFTVGLVIYALQLPGSRTGVMALFNPNWEYLLNSNLWLTAFGQLIFSYGLGYGIATTYSSYLPENSRLIDTAWIVVFLSLICEVLISIFIFAILGFMALGNNLTITSLVSDAYSLIFVVLPTAFNLMGPWVYIVAPAFFLILVTAGITVSLALIDPLAQSICEKFNWSKDRAIRNLVFVGLFASFIFATGMGEYLLRITESFLTQFAIILALLFELIVVGWVYDLDDVVNVLNANSFVKVDRFWIITIKFIIPIILIILWIAGVYNLIISGNRTILLVESIIASIFVLVPLALTVIPAGEDYYLDFNQQRESFNYFKGRSEFDVVEEEKSRLRPGPRNAPLRRSSSSKSDYQDDLKSTSKDDLNSDASKSSSKDDLNSDSSKFSSKDGLESSSQDDFKSSSKDGLESSSQDDFKSYSNDEASEDNESKGLKARLGSINPIGNRTSKLSKEKVDELYDGGESKGLFDRNGSFLDPFKNRNSGDGRSVLKNVDLSSSDFDSVKERESKMDNEDDELDRLINSLTDDSNESSDDFEVIEVEKPKSNGKRDHKFKKSSDYDFEDLDTSNATVYDLDDSDLDDSNITVFGPDSDDEESDSKSKSNKKSAKAGSDSKSKSNKKSKSKTQVEEVEYEEFTDDFFDDGIFGDEGYESLLDDYESKKPDKKSKSKKKSKDDDERYYDFEGKGADSVFNLDD